MKNYVLPLPLGNLKSVGGIRINTKNCHNIVNQLYFNFFKFKFKLKKKKRMKKDERGKCLFSTGQKTYHMSRKQKASIVDFEYRHFNIIV